MGKLSLRCIKGRFIGPLSPPVSLSSPSLDMLLTLSLLVNPPEMVGETHASANELECVRPMGWVRTG